MRNSAKILMLLIVIFPLLGAVGLTGGKNSGGCKNKKDKNTRVEKGDVNVVRKGKNYYVFGEVKNKKSRWLTNIQVQITLFDDTNTEVTSIKEDVIGKEPRRIASNNDITLSVLKKGRKGVFSHLFANVPANTTSAITKILSTKKKTLPLRARKRLKIRTTKLKVKNRKIRGQVINRSSIPVWDVKVYALVRDKNNDIISLESDDTIGTTEDIDGVNKDNVLNPNWQDNFEIKTKIDEDIVDVGDIDVWATWEEEIPSAPTVPENLVITETVDGNPFLSWDDSSDDEKGFIIYRRLKNRSNFKKLDTIVSIDTVGTTEKNSYEDTDVKSGKTYYYAVSAYKKGKPYLDRKILESGYSNQAAFTSP